MKRGKHSNTHIQTDIEEQEKRERKKRKIVGHLGTIEKLLGSREDDTLQRQLLPTLLHQATRKVTHVQQDVLVKEKRKPRKTEEKASYSLSFVTKDNARLFSFYFFSFPLLYFHLFPSLFLH